MEGGGGEIVTRTPRKPRKAKPAVSCPLPATTRRSACPLRAPPPPHRGASARASRQRRARPSRRRPRRPASPPDGAALGAGAGRGAGRGAGAAPRRALAPRPGRCLSAAMSGGARRRGGLGRRRPLWGGGGRAAAAGIHVGGQGLARQTPSRAEGPADPSPSSRGVSGGREPYPAGGGGRTWLTGARRAATCGWSGSTATGVTSAATTSTTRQPRRSSTSWRGSVWSTAPGSTGRNSTWGTRTTSSGTTSAAAGPHPAAGPGPLRAPRPRSSARPPPAPPAPLERGASIPRAAACPSCRPGLRRQSAPRVQSALWGSGERVGIRQGRPALPHALRPPARASPWVETARRWLLAVGFNGPCRVPATGAPCRNLYGRLCAGVPAGHGSLRVVARSPAAPECQRSGGRRRGNLVSALKHLGCGGG